MVPLIRQCAGTVAVAATGATDVTTVLGTGRAAAGKDDALQASAGALALATFRVATGSCRSLFDLKSSSVLMPGCRPTTVPVIAPASLGENAEVTSSPLSRTPARPMAAPEAAPMRTCTLSPLTKIGSGRLRLRRV